MSSIRPNFVFDYYRVGKTLATVTKNSEILFFQNVWWSTGHAKILQQNATKIPKPGDTFTQFAYKLVMFALIKNDTFAKFAHSAIFSVAFEQQLRIFD